MELLFKFFEPIVHINTLVVCMLVYLVWQVANHIPSQINRLENRMDRLENRMDSLDNNHKELSNKIDDLKDLIIDILKKK